MVLECQPPDSNPAPFINWKRDGSYLHGNDSRVVVLPTGNLYLLNVSLEDAGSYSCHAINPVTQHKRRSQPAVLTVTGEWLIGPCLPFLPGHRSSCPIVLRRKVPVALSEPWS